MKLLAKVGIALSVIILLAVMSTPVVYSQQGNLPSTLLPSSARTATISTSDQNNPSWNGIHVIVNVTAYTSGNFTPRIQGKDPVSGTYYDICVGPAIAATGTTILKLYPGIVPLANASCSDFLPRTWRLTVTGASTPVATYSVGAFLQE